MSGKGNLRKYHARGFTAISNNVMNDWTLSMRALACYARIQGLPEDWRFSITGLTKTFSTDRQRSDSKDSIRSALAELEEKGYIIRGRERKGGGTLGDGIWVCLDETSIYDAVVDDLLADGIQIITPRPEGLVVDSNAAFSVTSQKDYDPTFEKAALEAASPESDGDLETENEELQNPRSQPVSEKPIQALTRENSETVENIVENQNPPPAPRCGDIPPSTCDDAEKPQVATSVGLANVGSSDTTPYLEVNQKTNQPTDTRDQIVIARPQREPEPKPVPPARRRPCGWSVCWLDDGKRRDYAEGYKLLEDSAVNRNMLRTEADREATFEAYCRLREQTGADASELFSKWSAKQAECRENGWGDLYMPQLKRWLENPGPGGAAASVRPRKPHAGKDGERSRRAVRFARMRVEDPRLDELASRAADIEQSARWGNSEMDEAQAAWKTAWDYFDVREKAKGAAEGREAGIHAR